MNDPTTADRTQADLGPCTELGNAERNQGISEEQPHVYKSLS